MRLQDRVTVITGAAQGIGYACAARFAREGAKVVLSDIDEAAGEAAADIYGVGFLARNIEDEPGNTTRFLVIGRQRVPPSGEDKTTLLVSTGHTQEAGTLYHLLEPLSRHGVSMTRIESRPSRRRKWDYVFFLDVEGHAEESPVADALAELEKSASLFKVLGAYPKAIG